MYRSAHLVCCRYEDQLHEAFLHGINSDSETPVWDFWGSLFYCATIYTTIGRSSSSSSTTTSSLPTSGSSFFCFCSYIYGIPFFFFFFVCHIVLLVLFLLVVAVFCCCSFFLRLFSSPSSSRITYRKPSPNKIDTQVLQRQGLKDRLTSKNPQTLTVAKPLCKRLCWLLTASHRLLAATVSIIVKGQPWT